MPVLFKVFAVVTLAALPWLAAAQVRADTDADTAIRATLEQWRQDFNARRSERICDLFAPELRYDFQGLPEQTYPLMCERLRKALADPAHSPTLGLHIKEVIVSGSMAVARLTWRSTMAGPDGKSQTDEEQGLDVFARQADGSWKLIRFMAYPEQRE